MNFKITSVFFLVLFLLLGCGNRKVEIKVGSGKFPDQFSSIEAAILKAKEIKHENKRAKITIHLMPGTYYLEAPIEITSELNGLSIVGQGAAQVKVKGSKTMGLKWDKYDANIYKANIPEGIDFDQLIIDGVPQTMARYPDYDENGGYWQGYAADAISRERIASWKKPEGAYFHVMHGGRWGGFHYRINGVNPDGTPVLEGGHQNNRPSRPHDEYRMVENVFEALTSPKEWYLDKENATLYFYPHASVQLENATVEVAVLKTLLNVRGTVDNPVKDITIKGIKFEHTNRTFMEVFEPLLRSDWTIYRGAALFFEGTENCLVEDCEFAHLGGNVIMASKYTNGLTVKGNHIHDCGASAVAFIGDASAVRSPSFQYGEYVELEVMDTVPGPQNELYPRACLVEDNLIHRIGRIEKQTAGVQISMAMDITVRNNSIYDVPRAGINIGDGTWGGHVLEYNDVFNTVLETSDHGSFNSWGRDRFWHPNRGRMDEMTVANPQMPLWDAMHTTIIRNNRFRCDHGWDIDLDDGSTNYHIYNNLCLSRGIKLREGFYRVVENNITVNNSLHPHVWFVNSEDVFRKNIVADAYQDVGLLGWGKELDFNLFPNEESLMKSQIYERDMNSAFGDPMFKDPASLDFSVLDNSPALKLGFVNFQMDQFGVQKPDLKAIAKTPEVPVILDPSERAGKNSPVVAWLRNNLKGIDTEEEQSAYGLASTEGVIVLSVWNGSPAVKGNGLKKRDVILEVEGEKIKTTIDFLKVTKKFQEVGVINAVVMRDQNEQHVTIQIK